MDRSHANYFPQALPGLLLLHNQRLNDQVRSRLLKRLPIMMTGKGDGNRAHAAGSAMPPWLQQTVQQLAPGQPGIETAIMTGPMSAMPPAAGSQTAWPSAPPPGQPAAPMNPPPVPGAAPPPQLPPGMAPPPGQPGQPGDPNAMPQDPNAGPMPPMAEPPPPTLPACSRLRTARPRRPPHWRGSRTSTMSSY